MQKKTCSILSLTQKKDQIELPQPQKLPNIKPKQANKKINLNVIL